MSCTTTPAANRPFKVSSLTFRLILIFHFSLFTFHFSLSQNLVPNPSFEEYTECPTSTNQVYKATGWDIDINSSDYYNSCAVYNSMVDVPNNGAGFQCPASGNAYCGFYAYSKIQFPRQYREYFGRELSSPLTIGQKYYISFKLSPADYTTTCGTNNIGLKFTNFNYGDTSFYEAPVMNNFAHFYANEIISDTSEWTTISGYFIADSLYEYILIGNFFDDPHTDTSYIFGSSCQSYYYIDDVCVSTDSLICVIPNSSNFCDSSTYFHQADIIPREINAFPNPTSGKLFFSNQRQKNQLVRVYNAYGVLLREFHSDDLSDSNVNISDLPEGIYEVQLLNGNNCYTWKIMKIK